MLRTYDFCAGGPLEFDDSRSVRELIQYAFDQFDYYEPFGMEIVTLFQPQHGTGGDGWFTTDPDRSCADEIVKRDWLCFAYHMPGKFYYAEGGWGHHMPSLGNHPPMENPVSLSLCAEDFRHTIVFNGNLTFREVIRLFTRAEYFPADARCLEIRAVNPYQPPYLIPFSDPILDMDLVLFEQRLPDSVTYIHIK